ncbi:MAG: acyl carrier protein [Ruminiclostridium sp.]
MNREEVLEITKEILLGEEGLVLAESISDMSEETSLINDLVMDSLQILNLIVLIEDRFNFVCNEDELNLDMFDQIGELINFIESKCK